MVQRIHKRHAATGNRSGAGATVGLDDIAVDGDGMLAQGAQVNRCAQGTADQALDFHGAAALLAAGSFPPHAAAGGTG